MKTVIRELKDRVGVRGALVMANDGVVVAADLCDELDDDSVAALAAAVVNQTVEAAERLGLDRARRITLTASFGRLVFVPFDQLMLVVGTEPGLDLELTMLEIAGPAKRIHELSKLTTNCPS